MMERQRCDEQVVEQQVKLRGLDGLRGLAAAGVLVYHVDQLSKDHVAAPAHAIADRLWLGVPLFFVLSGFLLYRPFVAATLHGHRWPSLRRYARARFLRIFPAYWLCLSVTVVVLGRSPRPFAVLGIGLLLLAAPRPWRMFSILPLVLAIQLATEDTALATDAWAALSNYSLIYMTFGPYGVVGPAWSLCLEVSFYALLPALAYAAHLAARRSRSPQRRAIVLVAFLLPIAVVSLAYRGWIEVSDRIHLPAFLDWFVAGMLAAIIVTLTSQVSRRASASLLVGAGALAFGSLWLTHVGPESPLGNGTSTIYGTTMAVVFAMVILAVTLHDGPATRILAARPLRLLGLISYGVFLWHFPVIDVLRRKQDWTPSAYTNLLIVVGVTIPLATASWLLVERRALAFKQRAERGGTSTTSPVATAATTRQLDTALR